MKTASDKVQEIEVEMIDKCELVKPHKDHLTDYSNANKITELFGKKARFDHRRNRWLIWKKHRWQPDADGSINRLAIKAVCKRYEEAGKIEDSAQRSRAIKWAIQSESKSRLDSAVGIAKSLLPLTDAGDNWDTNPMLLSCLNGIVDLKTGKLRNGRPEDRITMSTGLDYDPKAKCPRWEQFLNEVFEDNEELIQYIHKALGYSITGSVKEQAAFFCFGAGSNGKSVLFKTISGALGDYAWDAPACLFQRSFNKTNSNDVAATESKRFLVTAETLSTAKLDERRLKAWTGGDKATARYLYQEFFTFKPTVKPWLFINHKPIIEDDSFGFWRRVRLIPFNKAFKGERDDKNLTKKLEKELLGILNWLIKGCLLWQKEGLEPSPEIVRVATQAYQQENDILTEFIFADCILDDKKMTKASFLYAGYTQWAERERYFGKDMLNRTNFGRRMGDKFKKKSKNDGNYYVGIALKSEKGGGFDKGATSVGGGLGPVFTKLSTIAPRVGGFSKNDPKLSTTSAKNSPNYPPLAKKSEITANLSISEKEVLIDD